jgi:hypothetical protein
MSRPIAFAATAWLVAFAATVQPVAQAQSPAQQLPPSPTPNGHPTRGTSLFTTHENCIACHNGLITPQGEDVSIGVAWRASIMANSARDPYWQASVRRETTDHPTASSEIEDECSVCHMPMSHTAEHADGGMGRILAHLPVTDKTDDMDLLAHDGVSCTLCHQITPQNFGRPTSFNGGYVIDTSQRVNRPVYGPYDAKPGLAHIMHSVTSYQQTESAHIRQAELCATCHTLYTTARGANGEAVGRLPEQMPFLEWQHSNYASERTCQSCHMPAVSEPTPIASVLSDPRPGMSRHTFLGGNFLMLRMLNRWRTDLGVVAEQQELEAAAQQTLAQLGNNSARISISDVSIEGGRLSADVSVENLTGHKLPTAYPSRRAWIHFIVKDADGRAVFESGGVASSGEIAGNDNDADPSKYEPHYREITTADQVEIYESVMVDRTGAVTTGLLSAVRYIKDNRLLPRGFAKATAVPDIAVLGEAGSDPAFTGGGHRIRYAVAISTARQPFTVEAELLYQPIGFRWAHNLQKYDAFEARRFVSYYDGMREGHTATLARTSVQVH